MMKRFLIYITIFITIFVVLASVRGSSAKMRGSSAKMRGSSAKMRGSSAKTSRPSKSTITPEEVLPIVGIPNVGNTCYANTCMQLLLRHPELTDVAALKNIRKNYYRGIRGGEMHSFITDVMPGRVVGSQEDAHEFMLRCLERHLPSKSKIVVNTSLECIDCQHCSDSTIEQTCVMLDPAQEWVSEEPLREEVELRCQKCTSKRAIKTTTHTLPKSFILHRSIYGKKIKPEGLIIATAHHLGHDGSGHYIATIHKNGVWWRVSDASVRQVRDGSSRSAVMVLVQR